MPLERIRREWRRWIALVTKLELRMNEVYSTSCLLSGNIARPSIRRKKQTPTADPAGFKRAVVARHPACVGPRHAICSQSGETRGRRAQMARRYRDPRKNDATSRVTAFARLSEPWQFDAGPNAAPLRFTVAAHGAHIKLTRLARHSARAIERSAKRLPA